MERCRLAAPIILALYSPSTPMERILPICMILLAFPLSLTLTATELIQILDWFYPATSCMGQRMMVAVQGVERYLPSTPMAQALQTCIILRQLYLITVVIILTATGLIRWGL